MDTEQPPLAGVPQVGTCGWSLLAGEAWDWAGLWRCMWVCTDEWKSQLWLRWHLSIHLDIKKGGEEDCL